MENNRHTLCITPKAISEGVLFRIPLYQRLFAWSKTEVQQLLTDLYEHYFNHREDEKKYYVGMLTVIQQDGRFDLIDGQQRMTALALIAIAMYHKLHEIDPKRAEEWRKVVLDHNNAPRIYFIGRTEDRDYLLSLYNGQHSEFENQKMKDGLETISTFLSDEVMFPDTDRLTKFADHIFKRLAIFITKLPDHYLNTPASLNDYFECMNSSGKPLEQHEILKVRLLEKQDKEKKVLFTRIWNKVSRMDCAIITKSSEDTEAVRQSDEYKRYLNLCSANDNNWVENLCTESDRESGPTIDIIPIAKKENKGSRVDKEDAPISFAQFLLFVLAINRYDDSIARVNPNKLLSTFKDNPPLDIDKFYSDLLRYRLVLDLYVVRIEQTPTGGVHSLIIKESDENNSIVHKQLKQYEAMLNVSTEPHIWILPLLKHIADSESLPTLRAVFEYLKEQDVSKWHLSYPPLHELDYDHRNRYWFWRLDYAIWEKMLLSGVDSFKDFGFNKVRIDRDAILQYEFRENRSIEHLHPQDQTHNELWEWDEVNRFGNLAMISVGFNSTQRNWLVDSKLENLKPQIENRSLQSLKLYFMYLQAKNDGSWTQGESGSMQRHEGKIYKLLQESVNPINHGQPESEREEL